MDILLGLILLASLVSLEYGSMKWERQPLAVSLILSLATMAVYWLWSLFGDSTIEVEYPIQKTAVLKQLWTLNVS